MVGVDVDYVMWPVGANQINKLSQLSIKYINKIRHQINYLIDFRRQTTL